MKKRYMYSILALLLVALMAMAACAPAGEENNPVNTDDMKTFETDATTSNPTSTIPQLPSTPLKLTGKAPESVNAGEQFSIIVSLEGNPEYENWCSVEFALKYDPEIISIDEIVTTELTSAMTSLSNLNYTEDSVKVGYASATDLTEYGEIVEIKCTAKTAGEFTAEFGEFFVYCFIPLEGNTGTTSAAALEAETFTVTVG